MEDTQLNLARASHQRDHQDSLTHSCHPQTDFERLNTCEEEARVADKGRFYRFGVTTSVAMGRGEINGER